MLTIGLTGGSGCGKSLFARYFAADRIPQLDADAIYHELTDRPSPCTEALAACFGRQILHEDGSLCRPALADLVFGSTEEHEARRATLNSVTHRYVRKMLCERIAEYAAAGAEAVLLDVPLLFEAGLECLCDCVIAVLAPYNERLRRILQRDGISEESALRRLAAQPPDDFYVSRADHIVMNDRGENELADEARRLCALLLPPRT